MQGTIPIEILLLQLDRIEKKLDTLIAALAEDDTEEQQFSLDGTLLPNGTEGQPL